MAFRIKPFLEIAAGMIAHMRAVNRTVTYYAPGSVARTMIEAPAIEIDELYQAYAAGLVETIPVALYRGFDFEYLDASGASGVVRILARPSHNAPISIPVGFLVASSAAQYRVAEAATIPVGADHVDVLAVCTTPGPAGNAAAGAIRFLIASALDVVGVTNPAAFANGKGKESEPERKLRFVQFVKALARGTTASCVYAAKLAAIIDHTTGIASERVIRAEPDETAGHVDIYVHNGVGNTSPALVARADALVQGYEDPATGEVVDGYRPTGMRVDLHAMAEIPVAVELEAEVPLLARSETLRARIAAAVAAVITATPNNGRLLPLSMQSVALTVPSVGGATIITPSTITPCPRDAVLVPGDIRVIWR